MRTVCPAPSMEAQSRGSNSIRVIVRIRPLNALEKAVGNGLCVEVQDNESLNLAGGSKAAFTFDRVFDSSATQQDVFEETAKPIVEDILDGYNGTIFCYGQTGSGKSFTLYGPSIDGADRGLVPRIVQTFFERMLHGPDTTEYTLQIGFFEIYLERIRDLLDESKDNLQIHEDPNNGVYVKGATQVYVSSVAETMDILRQGSANRAVAHTRMNAESSRSHSVFVLTVSQRDMLRNDEKVGKLFLVDLAGSEKISKTNATGMTLEEAKKINKSLSALGLVINSLTDGKSTHIPYRDSKLTRLLQESLGGNARTTVIINCSPSCYNEAETLSSLRFGARAKTVKNKARINVRLSAEELMRKLAQAERELRLLRQGVTAEPAGAQQRPVIDYERMTAVEAERDALTDRLAATEALNRAMAEQLERAALQSDSMEQQEKAALIQEVQDLTRSRDTALREAEQARAAAAELQAQLTAMAAAIHTQSGDADKAEATTLRKGSSAAETNAPQVTADMGAEVLVQRLSVLSTIYKQLGNENLRLKVDNAVRQQLLVARNERIAKLEKAMRASEELHFQSKLDANMRIASLEAVIDRQTHTRPAWPTHRVVVKHIKPTAAYGSVPPTGTLGR